MRCLDSRHPSRPWTLPLLVALAVTICVPCQVEAQIALRDGASPLGGSAGRTEEPVFGHAGRITWMVHVDPSAWDSVAFFDHGCFSKLSI